VSALVTFTEETTQASEGETQMPQLRNAPSFSIGDAWIPFYSENRIEWSCPACGVYGTVETSDDVDRTSEAIKTHHTLVSPDCLNSQHILDVVG
jgi:hypothetical protein